MHWDPQYHSIICLTSVPSGEACRGPRVPPCVCTVLEAELRQASSRQSQASRLSTQCGINSSERCFLDTQAEFKASPWQLTAFPLRKQRNVLHSSASRAVSCGSWLHGDLRLFTQVLVELGLQESGVRVILHQAVHPLLGRRKAASGSFLYILGNKTLGLKVYVDLK